jgi:glycosyltransferase involved in cell wall biosynthesis
MTIRVLMIPHLDDFGDNVKLESGIRRVVEAYSRHLPEFDIKLVGSKARKSFDLRAVHAGWTGPDCEVCHCHGLYWSADYEAPMAQYKTNARVIEAIRHAREVTVPAPWVAEPFQRDMHFTPHVVPHGIEWEEWQHQEECGGYVLWNKNRTGDVCAVKPLDELARRFPEQLFLTTFAPEKATPNVKATGLVPHPQMKRMIQQSKVYLATTKETFGIGTLEAMASGIPVLAFAHGGSVDLVEHCVNGYLAQPDDYEDLAEGLAYCLEHYAVLGANSRELAKRWTWEAACEQVAEVYRLAMQPEQEPTVCIVIPSFNYGDFVGKAIRSAMRQTYKLLTDIIVVDDGSDDSGKTEKVVKELAEKDNRIRYIRQRNSGVAVARNRGIAECDTKYICCLDADDEIDATFLAKTVPVIEADRSLGIVYTGIKLVWGSGKVRQGAWPGECNFARQVEGKNQVPTCCVFRRLAWERLGGYRQRYAPDGCGAEDAEFWLRIGAAGWGVDKATDERLFLYTLGGRTSGNPDYEEVDWLAWHPYCQDGGHPFASVAEPQNFSHPVRQYDEPLVSIIIPVGPGHETEVLNALDSVEAQNYRRWECIGVWDSPDRDDSLEKLKVAFPYVKWVLTDEPKSGAGKARNLGAIQARAPFLLFLDADDWLDPYALDKMLRAYSDAGGFVAVYSDYIGLAVIEEELAQQLEDARRLVDWDEDSHLAIISYRAADYDWHEATKQPESRQPYIWCNITTLVPKSWHEEIGGFDEKMESWEDWDYWLRLARNGKNFHRVPEPLLYYQFYSGDRRELGLQNYQFLVKYLREKYSGSEVMACKGCSGNQPQFRPMNQSGFAQELRPQELTLMLENFVECRYVHPNRGEHSVFGTYVFPSHASWHPMIRQGNGWRLSYGYHSYGDVFKVHRADMLANPQWYVKYEVEKKAAEVPLPLQPVHKPPPPIHLVEPEPVEQPMIAPELKAPLPPPPLPAAGEGERIDLQLLPGISAAVARQLEANSVMTIEAVLALGVEGLQGYKGVGEVRAGQIIGALRELQRLEAALG